MPITRAVLYARVSTEKQAAEGVSLDAQLEMAQQHCNIKDWYFLGQYVDVMSGRNDKRPELKRLMDDAKAKKFDTIIVYKLDRLGRSMRKLISVLGELQDLEINVVSLTQDIDYSTTMGRATIGILATFAQMESDHTAERVKSAMRHIVSKGRRFGGQRALGYNEVEGRYVINEEESETVREAFAAFLRLRTLRSTVEYLNTHGYKNRFGKPFTLQGLRVVLSNQVYIGTTAWSKSEIKKSSQGKRYRRNTPDKWIVCENTHDPIIDKSTWEDAQSLLLERNKTHPRELYGQQKYAWSGIIRCKNCGSKLTHNPGSKTNHYTNNGYRCGGGALVGQSYCSPRVGVTDLFLTYAAIPVLAKALRDAYNKASTSLSKPKTKPDRLQTAATRKIKELEAKREREKQLFRGGYCTFDEMAASIRDIDIQLSELGAVKEKPVAKLPEIPLNFEDAWHRCSEEGRGILLRSVVDYCEMSSDEFVFHLKPFDFPGWPDKIAVQKVSMLGKVKRKDG